MAKDDDLMTRLGELAREREREAEEELAAPSVRLPDPVALREAIVRQALAQQRVRPLRSRALWWAPGIAAAAAVVLVWLLRPSAEPLPSYALIPHGGLESERGATQTELRLRASSRLELEFKPRRDVTGPIQLRLFLQRGGRVTPLQPERVEQSESGAFRASFTAGTHFGPSPGKISIVAVVCRPDSCERAQTMLSDDADAKAETWQVLRIAAVYAQ